MPAVRAEGVTSHRGCDRAGRVTARGLLGLRIDDRSVSILASCSRGAPVVLGGVLRVGRPRRRCRRAGRRFERSAADPTDAADAARASAADASDSATPRAAAASPVRRRRPAAGGRGAAADVPAAAGAVHVPRELRGPPRARIRCAGELRRLSLLLGGAMCGRHRPGLSADSPDDGALSRSERLRRLLRLSDRGVLCPAARSRDLAGSRPG